ncbi:MAG TPA: tripartite tricarboxylate transporter TctB family protein [Pseudolabrys sp.]|nr:tripartite tricarboxylate transporter TctB family protein [Pseudolabrys sp.]
MSDGAKASPRWGRFQFKVRGPRDFFGGLALIALAILAIWASGDLPGQAGFAFGPGTAPRMFASLLAIVGAFVALSGLLIDGPPIESFALKGPAYVVGAILLFALLIRGASLEYIGLPVQLPALGLVPATFIAFMVSIMGSSEMRWIESLLAAVAMTVFCVLLFVYLLGLPFQLWPWV